MVGCGRRGFFGLGLFVLFLFLLLAQAEFMHAEEDETDERCGHDGCGDLGQAASHANSHREKDHHVILGVADPGSVSYETHHARQTEGPNEIVGHKNPDQAAADAEEELALHQGGTVFFPFAGVGGTVNQGQNQPQGTGQSELREDYVPCAGVVPEVGLKFAQECVWHRLWRRGAEGLLLGVEPIQDFLEQINCFASLFVVGWTQTDIPGGGAIPGLGLRNCPREDKECQENTQ